MLVEASIGNILDTPADQGEDIDWLDLTWSQCGQRAIKKQTRGGMTMRILLRLGCVLRHGDLLRTQDGDGPMIAVNVIPCEVLVARPRDRTEWIAVAYELGNLHAATQIDGDQIITVCDGPTEALFAQLGLPTELHVQRFEPSFRGLPSIALISSNQG